MNPAADLPPPASPAKESPNVAEKDQFYSFEEALKELRLREEELKRLVSEGEIRAFREGETMKLRRADVETLRNELSGGEVVDLGEVREELVFEDDADLVDETGMATEEISNVETIIEDDVPDVGEIEIEETVVAEDEDLELEPAAAGPRVLQTEIVDESGYEGAGIRVAMALTTLLLVLAIPLVLAAGTGQGSGVSSALASLFGK
jgi:excisionase family DNA binding protein